MSAQRQTPRSQRRPPPSGAPTSPARRKTARWSGQTFVLLLVMFGAGLTFLAVAVFALILLATPARIQDGVAVAGLNLGGLTTSAARERLQASLPAQQILLTDGARQWAVSALELGVGIDLESTLKQAADSPENTLLPPVYTIDLVRAQTAFLALAAQVDIQAQPGVDGRVMDAPVMLERLRVDVAGEIADGAMELNMIAIPAPVPKTTHVVEAGQELALIARQYGVGVQDILDYNNIADPDLIYPGQVLTIPAEGDYIPANPPPPPTNIGKAIVVATGEQRIYAYQDGQMVRTHLVSTGTMVTPTVMGDYSVYVKYRATDMSGPGYYLPQVPYTMYFFQGYGIHGTYWHNSFGRPMSHGCVNLPVDEAEWFFSFAEVGTPVRVI
ncbi:MAG: L,D-transpeptidase family protein [Anaerolineae bacterium]|nr:L,D-transpeptidase family protein [Anaerolineae bacterium]